MTYEEIESYAIMHILESDSTKAFEKMQQWIEGALWMQQQTNGVNTSHEPALHKHGVTNRTCVTCLLCQANPSSEFRYDKHKCTLVKPFVNITDATKFVCDEWTEIPF